MGRMSRNKGKRGEREVALMLRAKGFADARRGQQYCGIDGNADVVGLPGVHIEVKRVEALNRKEAMNQAERDAREGEIPVVFHRRTGEDWCVIMKANDFLDLYIKGLDKEEATKCSD